MGVLAVVRMVVLAVVVVAVRDKVAMRENNIRVVISVGVVL